MGTGTGAPRILSGLLALAMLVVAGCGSIPGIGASGRTASEVDPGTGATPETGRAPLAGPSWGSSRGSSGGPAGSVPDLQGRSQAQLQPYSRDPFTLYGEVADRCAGARVNQEAGFLPTLVADLFQSGVDPGHATEALILGDCAPLEAVVTEMVAQGGEGVTTEVVQRALNLGGPGAEPIIESAAAAGLERGPGVAAADPGREDSRGLSYGMAYFPSRAPVASLEQAGAVNTLYGNATPGYAIYTFVLLGAGADMPNASGAGRLQELLRVIDSYVLAGDAGSGAPNTVTHAFLIAVHPERADADLAGQTGPELSTPIRRDLARYLRRNGNASLAARLEGNPGPFLVSSLEPSLLPRGALSPRLVTDLSDIGGEYMYAIVDAYDRPVPADLAGRPESLDAIREQLIGLFDRQVPGEDLEASVEDAWVFRVGARSSIVSGEGAAGGPAAGPGQGSGQRPRGHDQRQPSIGYQSPRVRGT